MYTIGYVDEDESEVSRVRRNLKSDFNVIGYHVSDGIDKNTLVNKIYESDIDLLMVDFLMKEKNVVNYNGDEVVREFEKIKPDFPVIIFTSNEADAFPAVDDVNMIYDKDNLDDGKKQRFVKVLNKNIARYNQQVNDLKITLEKLLIKRDEQGLSSQEKDALFATQLELARLDKKQFNETPNRILSDGNLDKLSAVTENAEQLLQELIKKHKDDAV